VPHKKDFHCYPSRKKTTAMLEKKLVPKLRFAEFDGVWKVKQIANILTIGSGKDYKHLSSGNIPVYGTGGFMTAVNEFIFDGESVCIGRKGTIDKPMFLNEKFWTVDTLFYTHSFSGVTPKFVYSLFQNIIWYKYNEASGVPSLSKNTIGKIEVTIPQLPEQQKITSFLTEVDTKLSQLTKKKALLENYKKGVMQQIFSQQLRFKDGNGNDYGDWEEKKLGEICIMTSSKRVYLSDYVYEGVPFYRGKEISDLKNNKIPADILYISEERYQDYKSKYGVPKIDDILITAVGTLGNVLRIANDEKFYFKDGNLIWLKDVKVYSSFLEILLQFNTFKLLVTAIGSSQKALTMVELRKLIFLFPSNLEQIKIANFLSELDSKIEVLSTSIENTQTFKKGLLQQLFV
jgi:restriction endonuclease S subunit